ncbi:hypothetical protein THAR02_00605 [Trichoderma harzianum]|uniref:Uncharacterized protein n=1 Tax=Trichoderma harzianum TaxID=5544 RepID=A0A0F9XRH4_TRIHA|nr:hypothetical protein THAR02_00605 [Trichoderma harzianum]
MPEAEDWTVVRPESRRSRRYPTQQPTSTSTPEGLKAPDKMPAPADWTMVRYKTRRSRRGQGSTSTSNPFSQPSRSVSLETNEDGSDIDGDMDDSNSDEVMEENDSEDESFDNEAV